MGTATSPTADREIVIVRTVKAPRAQVFRAFTDARHIDRWWGPAGFRNETLHMDVRPGGSWRFIMHGPNGMDFPNRIIYLRVEEPALLEYDHGADDGEAPHFHVTITFVADGADRTTVTLRSLFPTAAARDRVVREVKAIEGGNQTMDRLEAYLAGQAEG